MNSESPSPTAQGEDLLVTQNGEARSPKEFNQASDLNTSFDSTPQRTKKTREPQSALSPRIQHHEANQFMNSEPNISNYRVKLDGIFKGAVANSGNTAKYMLPPARFRVLMTDFNIADTELPIRECDLTYVKVCGAGRDMLFEHFTIALHELAYKKYVKKREKKTRVELYQILLEFILAQEATVQSYIHFTPKTRATDAYSIERIFFIYEKVLKNIFATYCETYTGPSTPTQEVIMYHKFISFAKAFKMFPILLSTLDVQRFYKSFNEGNEVRENEPLYLTQSEFHDCLARIAVFLFSKPPFNKEFPTTEDKINKFLQDFSEPYEKMFKTPMINELIDLSNIGPPSVKSVEPKQVPFAGGAEIWVVGNNFDRRKGGVYCRVGKVTVQASDVSKTRVKISVPCLEDTGSTPDIVIDINQGENLMTYNVEIQDRAEVLVTSSNDNEMYSMSSTAVQYVDKMPAFELGPEIVGQLEQLFQACCKFEDPYNTKSMNLTKWIMFKTDIGNIRSLEMPLVDNKHEDQSYEPIDSEEERPHLEFFKFATTGRGNLVLSFPLFLKTLIYYAITNVEGLHPVDFFINIIKHRDEIRLGSKQQTSVENSEEKATLQHELKSVIRRRHRSFDVYSGPVPVGLLEEVPGNVVNQKGKVFMKHKFLTYHHLDISTESVVLKHIQMSETFTHLLRRLLAVGFDLATSQAPESRQPLGRCWHIFTPTKELIGALWDYPGQFSSLEIHPRAGDLENENATLSVYANDESTMLQLLKCFIDAKNIQQLREYLERHGWKLRTALYKIFK